VFDAHSGEDVDGSIVAYGYFVRACSSCQSNRVLQSTEPKKGSLHVMSHEATRDEAAVSGTTWMRSSSESAVVVFLQICLPACLTDKEELKSSECQGVEEEPID
jgi:hypothetical protein